MNSIHVNEFIYLILFAIFPIKKKHIRDVENKWYALNCIWIHVIARLRSGPFGETAYCMNKMKNQSVNKQSSTSATKRCHKNISVPKLEKKKNQELSTKMTNV